MAPDPLTFYAVPHSLYAGRARSYLIKAGIAYREVTTNSAHFHRVVKPKAGGKVTVPTVEFSDGSVIRDGAAIIDFFEERSGRAFSPRTPKQNVISRLFDVIGAEGLLRPAMHYRWSFPTQHHAFLKHHFKMIARPGAREEEHTEKLMHAMRDVAGPSFGVSPQTAPVIEDLYTDQLAALDQHFAQHGYLLGGRPCIGDFGMIAPLFAHLGRDPVPLAMMQSQALQVYRWVERMNRHASDLGEFHDQDEGWLPDDAVPATLVAVMRAMAEDFVPETLAAANRINAWLDAEGDLAAGAVCERGLGMGRFELRGVEIHALAQPYRFYLLARFQDAYRALVGKDQSDMDAILAETQMSPLVDCRLSRSIGRKGNLEVWL